ncbi:steroid 3-ketoacyl-CoA thiolase [Streptomyces sp.]|uniref:steroid 3-ketoacyl-CoA thiolase n=1 Tax=Streptomyces sp. TaxID=1931 RepID=UPI002810D21B|nr:steroid 3-ketoacyl-CoA thiolase [Streptomyces sp.]
MPAEPVIVEAVRTPLGRRGGALARLHPARLLGEAYRELLGRTGIPADCVEQVVGGTATLAGEQAGNPARTAWLAMGLPYETAASTVDAQGGSSQQASHMVADMIAAGVIDVGVSCGVESTSRVPPGSGSPFGSGAREPLGDGAGPRPGTGSPFPDGWDIDLPHPVEAAERIARRRGLTREHADALGLLSRERAALARSEERFKREIFPVRVPATEEERVAGHTPGRLVDRDEVPGDTGMEELARLRPLFPLAIHTAGSAAPAADGAAALLWASRRAARALKLRPRARIVARALVGADPHHPLDGPVDATRAVLGRTGMSLRDIDLVEIDEVFASVVLGWAREFGNDLDGLEKVNVNGGALALGHPVGATGARLLTTALHELERADKEFALVTVGAGGALAAATILQRL